MKRSRNNRPRAAAVIMSAALLAMLAALIVMFGRFLLVKCEPSAYNPYIAAAARKYGVDPDLIRAVIYTETKFDADAVGNAGEIGLMQVLPSGAAADYARVNRVPPVTPMQLFNPELNIDIGAWFLAEGLREYAGRPDAALLAVCRYNAGNSRARRWAEAPAGEVMAKIDIASTGEYVKKVMARMELYKEMAE